MHFNFQKKSDFQCALKIPELKLSNSWRNRITPLAKLPWLWGEKRPLKSYRLLSGSFCNLILLDLQ